MPEVNKRTSTSTGMLYFPLINRHCLCADGDKIHTFKNCLVTNFGFGKDWVLADELSYIQIYLCMDEVGLEVSTPCKFPVRIEDPNHPGVTHSFCSTPGDKIHDCGAKKSSDFPFLSSLLEATPKEYAFDHATIQECLQFQLTVDNAFKAKAAYPHYEVPVVNAYESATTTTPCPSEATQAYPSPPSPHGEYPKHIEPVVKHSPPPPNGAYPGHDAKVKHSPPGGPNTHAPAYPSQPSVKPSGPYGPHGPPEVPIVKEDHGKPPSPPCDPDSDVPCKDEHVKHVEPPAYGSSPKVPIVKEDHGKPPSPPCGPDSDVPCKDEHVKHVEPPVYGPQPPSPPCGPNGCDGGDEPVKPIVKGSHSNAVQPKKRKNTKRSKRQDVKSPGSPHKYGGVPGGKGPVKRKCKPGTPKSAY
jgi:hypothetical protein